MTIEENQKSRFVGRRTAPEAERPEQMNVTDSESSVTDEEESAEVVAEVIDSERAEFERYRERRKAHERDMESAAFMNCTSATYTVVLIGLALVLGLPLFFFIAAMCIAASHL